jgi:hypothetical protein
MRACTRFAWLPVAFAPHYGLETIPESSVQDILQGCGIDPDFVVKQSGDPDLAEPKEILGLLTGRPFKDSIEKSCSHMIVDDDDDRAAAGNKCCMVLKKLVEVLVKPRNPDDSGPFRTVLNELEALSPQSDPGQRAFDRAELERMLASFNGDE